MLLKYNTLSNSQTILQMNPSWVKLAKINNQYNAIAAFLQKSSLCLIKSYALAALVLDAYP
jgi:hypothetical protein